LQWRGEGREEEDRKGKGEGVRGAEMEGRGVGTAADWLRPVLHQSHTLTTL